MVPKSLRGLVALLCCAWRTAHGAASHELYIGGAGWALQFDGVNDFAYLLEDLPPPPLTIELWVRPLDSSNGQGEKITQYDRKAVVMGRYSPEVGENLFSILYNGGEIWLKEYTVSGVRTNEVTPGEGKLYHYAFVAHNQSRWTAYINGRAAKTGILTPGIIDAMSGALVSSFPWMLGGRTSYNAGTFNMDDRCFGGQLDELRWWSKALSEQELRKWMAVAPQPGEPGLHRRWGFDDAAREAPWLRKGGGDAARSPSRVPSPVPLVGGPVAVDTFDGTPPVTARLCAAIVPPAPGATANATFSAQNASSAAGSVGPATGAQDSVSWGQELTVELLPQSGAGGDGVATMLCGEVRFRPTAGGSASLPFDVEVRLPASAGAARLSASERLEARVSKNLPPTAGLAKAISTDGRSSYASLGVWDLPTGAGEAFTYSFWVKPDVVVSDTYMLSLHMSKGSNLFLFGFWVDMYNVLIYCRNDCNAGAGATAKAYFPPGPDDAVLPSGKTVRQVKEERSLPHLLTVSLHCHSRGNADPVVDPARATLKMYVDGDSIGSLEVPACLHSPLLPEDHGADVDPGYHPTPWELGAEYDGGPAGRHAPGVSVVPSNFFAGVFDDVRFWRRELTPQEVGALASGQSVAEQDAVVRYSFDLDDPAVCLEQRLADSRTQCHALNEARGRTRPSARFPFTNSPMGDGAAVVNSPFYQVPGSSLHKAVQEGTCESVRLRGSDPNGDALAFGLAPGFGLPGLEFRSGDELRYCAPSLAAARANASGSRSGARGGVEVEVPFDACDPLGLCASGFSGLGRAVFHVLEEGPAIVHFQVLPEKSILRLVFSRPTSAPDVSSQEARARLLTVSGLGSDAVVLVGGWEGGSTALRLDLAKRGAPGEAPDWMQALAAGAPAWQGGNGSNASDASWRLWRSLQRQLAVQLLKSGMLRDAEQKSFPSISSAAMPDVIFCGDSKILRAGAVRCEGCPAGSFLLAGSCEPCQPGWFQPRAGQKQCEPCPLGTYTGQQGAASCASCDGGLRGSTTAFQAATDPSSCRCPAGAAFSRDSPSAAPSCRKCGDGLSCLGGVRPGAAGASTAGRRHQPPLQAEGFSAGAPAWEGGPPSFLARCSSKLRCPAGLELGACPPRMRARACALCEDGSFPRGEACDGCEEVAGIEFTILSACFVVAAVLGVAWFGTRPIGLFCTPAAVIVTTCTTSLAAIQVLGTISTLTLAWPEPMDSLRGVLSFLVLDVNRQRPQCIAGRDSALLPYFGSLAAYPILACLLSFALLLAKLLDPKMNTSSFINAHGIAISSLFTPIAVVCALPLSCASNNPDGSSTVTTYRSVVCWETEEHIAMVVAAILSFIIFVVGFLAISSWATLVYKKKMASPQASKHMARYRFVFGPYVPDKYYFGLIFSTRKLLIGLTPMVAANLPQVQLLFVTAVVVTHMVLQVALCPWRTFASNVFDTVSSAALLTVILAGFMLGDFDVQQSRTVAQTMLFMGLLAAAALVLLILSYCAFTLVYRKRQYEFFLSHHKVGAGLLARWVKIILHSKGHAQVFLDSDNLLQLDKLINIVAYDCENIVVLLTRETLSRPWCAMEVVAAFKARRPVVPVWCDDYLGVTDDFLEGLPEIWTEEQQATMALGGVRIEDVRRAYASFRELPKIVLARSCADPVAHALMVDEVLARCRGRAPSKQSQAKRAPAQGAGVEDTKVAFVSDMQAVEVACACRVLQHMLQEKLQQGIEILSSTSRSNVKTAYVLVVLRPGITREQWFAEALVQVVNFPALAEMAPVIVGDFFDFPTSGFWEDLAAGRIFKHEDLEEKNLTSGMVESAYRKLFNTLAMRFTGHASTMVQRTEVLSMCMRIRAVIGASGPAEDAVDMMKGMRSLRTGGTKMVQAMSMRLTTAICRSNSGQAEGAARQSGGPTTSASSEAGTAKSEPRESARSEAGTAKGEPQDSAGGEAGVAKTEPPAAPEEGPPEPQVDRSGKVIMSL